MCQRLLPCKFPCTMGHLLEVLLRRRRWEHQIVYRCVGKDPHHSCMRSPQVHSSKYQTEVEVEGWEVERAVGDMVEGWEGMRWRLSGTQPNI